MTKTILTQPRKLLPLTLMLAGLLLLTSVTLPMLFSTLKFYLNQPPDLFDPTDVPPLPAPKIVNTLGIASDDYSPASEWFAPANLPPPVASRVSHFTLSIPAVGIIDLPVEVNGADLRQNAIHFPGSSLPGTYGNTIILGHSALPQFYTKDNPLTLFNPLIKIKTGDEVLVRFDGVNYRYHIKQTQEVTPNQVSVLAQKYDRREITLITCVPLGTYWRRFVAVGELVN